MHKLYRWDFIKLTMMFQSSRVLILVSTHRDSRSDSTANSTGTRYRYTGLLHYMKCIGQSRLVGAIRSESLNKFVPRKFFKHSSRDNYRVFIHPVTNNIGTMYRGNTLQFFLQQPGSKKPRRGSRDHSPRDRSRGGRPQAGVGANQARYCQGNVMTCITPTPLRRECFNRQYQTYLEWNDLERLKYILVFLCIGLELLVSITDSR